MTSVSDLTIPLSALEWGDDGQATAMAGDWSAIEIGVLLQAVVERAAGSLVEVAPLHTVSVTFDVSFPVAPGSEIQFASRIDRRTRTLIFASGVARQRDSHILKSTIVFRIG
jgi:hypothetical protein